MRRSLVAIGGTVVGLTGLLGYKSGPPPKRLSAGGPATTPSTRPESTNVSSPTTTEPSSGSETKLDGPDVPNRFGDVQVQVVVRGRRIVDVVPIQLPNDRPRSAYISEQAAPMLRQEVLDAQSANIDFISGATYTSESYAQSVQAALDRVRST